MKLTSRRALLGGAGSVLVAGGLETASLAGGFDHRTSAHEQRSDAVRQVLAERRDGIVHIGHSTHVLDLDGVRLLTDPWFSDPAFGALAHAVGPACGIDDLSDVDAILVSHEHPDHADFAALDRFARKSQARVLVGTSTLRDRFRAAGYRDVSVLAEWETFALGALEVQAVPALHDVPELGFVVRGSRARVYFAGDTAFQPAFEEIRERCRPSFALLPVDGTSLRGSEHATLDAVDAVRAARSLGVEGVMPSHAEARFTDPFAEHILTRTSPNGGPARFAREMSRALPTVRCVVPSAGERVDV